MTGNCCIHGKENLISGPAIILSKHQSAWETLFFQAFLPPQSWILKKELLQIPIFGWVLALVKPIAINRKKKDIANDIIKQGIVRLQSGLWLIIFPEGTRVAPYTKNKYSQIGAAISLASGYPIIPIAHNAGTCWPKNSFIKTPGTITVIIGPKIEGGTSSRQLTNMAEQWIEQQMNFLYAQSVTTQD